MVNRIRELREAKNWTREELADRSGTSASQVYRLENGTRALTDSWMRQLARAFNCAASDLLPDEDFNPRLQPLENQVLRHLRSLSDHNQPRLVQLLATASTLFAEAEGMIPPPKQIETNGSNGNENAA